MLKEYGEESLSQMEMWRPKAQGTIYSLYGYGWIGSLQRSRQIIKKLQELGLPSTLAARATPVTDKEETEPRLPMIQVPLGGQDGAIGLVYCPWMYTELKEVAQSLADVKEGIRAPQIVIDQLPAELGTVPQKLWAQGKYDVGLMATAPPVIVHPKSKYRPKKAQIHFET
ncbi:hypothetical protein SRHO_G00141530 [Serrasalmus rhombeus]